jgi:hypothetical protein
MSLVVQFIGKLLDQFDLLFSKLIDVCDLSVELIFESCLRFGLSGSNTQPAFYILLYLVAVFRFRLKEWINEKRELGG